MCIVRRLSHFEDSQFPDKLTEDAIRKQDDEAERKELRKKKNDLKELHYESVSIQFLSVVTFAPFGIPAMVTSLAFFIFRFRTDHRLMFLQ